MYTDPKDFPTPLSETEVEARADLVAELSARIDAIASPALTTLPYVVKNDKYYAAGIGVGYIPEKKEKPFVIVDGVVYINASMIKECTL